MLPENRISTHPGEILLEDYLEPMAMAPADFANRIAVSPAEIEGVVRGTHPVHPRLAWLFAMALGTTPQFWTNLQSSHDLTKTRPEHTVPRLAG